MTSGPVTAIICDVGDVLIQFDKTLQHRLEERHRLRTGQIREVLLRSDDTRRASVGEISQQMWLERVAAHVPFDAVTQWLGDHGTLNTDLADLLTSLRQQGITLVLLSNATRRLWADLAHHGLLDFADRVYCSADMGLAKPDPLAYKHVIGDAGLAPASTVYIDDTASWVEAGSAHGLLGHVYTTAGALRAFLTGLGVTPWPR